MKAIKLFSMAVAALMMAACSNEDNDVQQPAQTRNLHFVATLAAPNSGAATRTTYTEITEGTDAGSIKVAWVEGDEIALIHNNAKIKVLKVKTVDTSTGAATIEGEITGLSDGDIVTLAYPASGVGDDGQPTAAAQLLQLQQDGTLAYIQNNLDARMGEGKISVSGSNATLKENVKMESQMAIWKLTLQDNASNAINAKTVTLKLGGKAIAGGKYDSGMSSYYICVVPATLTKLYDAAATWSLPTPAFTIEAYDGTNTYTYTKTSKLTLANSAYYQSTVTMLPYPIALSAVTNAYVGSVVTSDGKVYATVADATTASKTAVAMIAYVSSTGHGLALQLNSIPETKNWADAKSYAEGLATVSGGTWRLPSKADWQNMFLACAKSGDASSASDKMKPIAGFKEKITATGTTWQSSKFYWSSTKVSESSTNAWCVSVNLVDSPTSANFYEGATNLSYYVLGCLAF